MAYDPNCPETKAAFDEMLAAKTAGLVSKRDELLQEVKDLRKGGDISAATAAKMERLEAQLETANAALETARTESASTKRELTKVTGKLDVQTKVNTDLTLDSTLASALTENKIAPQFSKAVDAMFRKDAVVKIEDGKPVVYVGDKPIGEVVKSFAQSDEGKHFVAAPSNSGGGSNGGTNKPTGKSMTREAFDGLGAEERMSFMKDGGSVTQPAD